MKLFTNKLKKIIYSFINVASKLPDNICKKKKWQMEIVYQLLKIQWYCNQKLIFFIKYSKVIESLPQSQNFYENGFPQHL